MSELEFSLSATKFRELLSLFSGHTEIPMEIGRNGILVDFMASDMHSYQHTLIHSKAFKTYKIKKPFHIWIDISKLSKRTSKMKGEMVFKIKGDKIHVSAGGIKRKLTLMSKDKPQKLFTFDKNGVPNIDETEYDTVAEFKIPKGSIFGLEVEMKFENDEIILAQKDFDSEGEDVIGKYESAQGAEDTFTFHFYGKKLIQMSSLLESSKTKYILASATTSRPMSCVTVAKDFKNYIILLPINKTQEELPYEIKKMGTSDTEAEDEEDDFDLDYDEDEEEED